MIDNINRELMLGLIELFEGDSDIDHDSVHTMKCFIKVLPDNIYLPKIAPDGEGGFIAIWEPENLIIVIHHDTISMVTQAATSQVQYFDDIFFNQRSIPSEILLAFDKIMV